MTTAERKSEAQRLADSMGKTEIAQHLGVSRSTVYAYLRHRIPPERRHRRWTSEAIAGALVRFHHEHGRRPAASDFTPPTPGAGFPSISTIIEECGSFNAAMQSAGYTPRPPGHPG